MPAPSNRRKTGKSGARKAKARGTNPPRALTHSLREGYTDDVDDADGWTPIVNTLCSAFNLRDLSTRQGLKKVHANFDEIYAKLDNEYQKHLSNEKIRGGIVAIYTKMCVDAVLRNKLFERGLLNKLLPLLEVDSMCHMGLRALFNVTHHGGVDVRRAIASKSNIITALVDRYPLDPVICELSVSILSHTIIACTEGPEHDPSIPRLLKGIDMVQVLKAGVHCMTQSLSERSHIEHGTSLLAGSTLHATNAHRQVPEATKILVAGLRSPDWAQRSICFGGLQRLNKRGSETELQSVNPHMIMSISRHIPTHINEALAAYGHNKCDTYQMARATTEYMQLMSTFPKNLDLYSLGMRLSEIILSTEYSIWDSFYDMQRYNPQTGETDDRNFKLPFNRWSDALPLCAQAICEKGDPGKRDVANVLDIKYLILRQRPDDAAALGREALKHNPSVAYFYYAISLAADRTNGLRASKQGLKCEDTTSFIKFQLMQRAVDHAAELGMETLQFMPEVGDAKWDLALSLLRSALEDAKRFMKEAPPDNRYMKSVVYWYVVLTVVLSEEVHLDSPEIKHATEKLNISEDVASLLSNGAPDTMMRRTYKTIVSLFHESKGKYQYLFERAAKERDLPNISLPSDTGSIQDDLAAWLDNIVLEDGEDEAEHHGGHDHLHKRDMMQHVHQISFSNRAAEADRAEMFRCSHCGNPSAGLRKCSGCAKARYCDAMCQKAHWKEHKRACKSRGELEERQFRTHHRLHKAMAKSHTVVNYSSFSGASRRLIEASGTPDTARYHAQINKRVQELEHEVRRIEQEISALKTCRNAVATTNRLPVEVLTNIFYFVSKFHTCRDILNVSHICRRWRSIVLDHRHFFGDLQGDTILMEAPLTRTMLWMSEDAPLTFSWTGSKYGDPLNLDAVNCAVYDGVERFKSFVFWRSEGDKYNDGPSKDFGTDWTLQDVFSSWRDPKSRAPKLEKLSIMNIVVDGYYESNCEVPEMATLREGHWKPGKYSYYEEPTIFKGGAPALRDMTLSHNGIAWKGLPLGSSLVNLRLLEDHRLGESIRPTTSEFITSLRQMPQLQTVELHNFLPKTDAAHVGEVFTFPPTLKTLKITDDCDHLSHFLQITHVLDHVSITVAFFQYSIDSTAIGQVLAHLRKVIGENRPHAGVTKLVDEGGACFQLFFGDPGAPGGGKGFNGHLAPVTVDCGLGGPTHCLYPVEYHLLLTKYFDISCLQAFHLRHTNMEFYGDDVWALFNGLPKLNLLSFHRSHFGAFIDQLKPKDPSSSTEDPPSTQQLCPFPALTKIVATSPTEIKPTASQDRDGNDCASRFTNILNARKELGSPLEWVGFAEPEFSEGAAEQLRESVPGLVVYRSGEEWTPARDTRAL